MFKKFPLIALVVIVAGAVIGGLAGRLPGKAAADNVVTGETVLRAMRDASELIESNYGGDVELGKITESSIQSMLWSLDPHSSFFNREELKKLDEEQASQFYGIGVSIFRHRDGVYVQSVVPGTPADKSGLRYGDKIVSVEGKDALDWSSAEVSKNVRGERGSTVKVRVERAASATPIDFEIVRGGVPLPSVRNSFMLPNGTGYIGLTGGFQQTTADEVRSAIAELKKQGMKNLILDLRGNPGGILEQAVGVVSQFVPAGQPVVSVKTPRFDKARTMPASGGPVETFPLVVMINGGSASASEIVAGAIQDYDRGVIVGTDSFGKGLVQRVFRLPYGTGLTLTTARYYTPFGRSLQRDYSTGSIYDYYTHLADDPESGEHVPKPQGVPVTTTNGRVLFGGRGIEPDVKVEPVKDAELKARINEAAFFFVRQLVAGKIAGLESFRNEKQSFKEELQPNEFAVSDRVFDAFRTYTLAEPKNHLSADAIAALSDYARVRIREELATANYSSEAGIQVLLENDPQIAKAIQSMAQAGKLVETASVFERK